MEGVDLEQPARVLWWGKDQIPMTGLAWGGSDRKFKSLRKAIIFVLQELSKAERHTALILIDAKPHSLNFSLPGAKKAAKEILACGSTCFAASRIPVRGATEERPNRPLVSIERTGSRDPRHRCTF
jgi:hypothetical protein